MLLVSFELMVFRLKILVKHLLNYWLNHMHQDNLSKTVKRDLFKILLRTVWNNFHSKKFEWFWNSFQIHQDRFLEMKLKKAFGITQFRTRDSETYCKVTHFWKCNSGILCVKYSSLIGSSECCYSNAITIIFYK